MTTSKAKKNTSPTSSSDNNKSSKQSTKGSLVSPRTTTTMPSTTASTPLLGNHSSSESTSSGNKKSSAAHNKKSTATTSSSSSSAATTTTTTAVTTRPHSNSNSSTTSSSSAKDHHHQPPLLVSTSHVQYGSNSAHHSNSAPATPTAAATATTTSSGDRLLREIFSLRLSRLSTKLTLGLMLTVLLWLTMLTILGICVSLLLYLVLYPYHNYFESRSSIDLNHNVQINSIVSSVNGVVRQGAATFDTESMQWLSISPIYKQQQRQQQQQQQHEQESIMDYDKKTTMDDDMVLRYWNMENGESSSHVAAEITNCNITSSYLIQFPFESNEDNNTSTFANNQKNYYYSSFMVYSGSDGCIYVRPLSRSTLDQSTERQRRRSSRRDFKREHTYSNTNKNNKNNHSEMMDDLRHCESSIETSSIEIRSVQSLNYRESSSNETSVYQSEMAILFSFIDQESQVMQLKLITVNIENDQFVFDTNSTTIAKAVDTEERIWSTKMVCISPFRVLVLYDQPNGSEYNRRYNVDWFSYHSTNGTWTKNGTISLTNAGQDTDDELYSADISTVTDSYVLVVANGYIYAIEYDQKYRVIDSQMINCPHYAGSDIFSYDAKYNYQLRTDCDGSFIIHCRANFILGYMNNNNQLVLGDEPQSLGALVNIREDVDPQAIVLLSSASDIGCLTSNCSQTMYAINYHNDGQFYTSMCAVSQQTQMSCSLPFRHAYHSKGSITNGGNSLLSTMIIQKPTYYRSCWNEFLIVSLLKSDTGEFSILSESVRWYGGITVLGISTQGASSFGSVSSTTVCHKGLLQLSRGLGGNIVPGQTLYAKPDGTLTSTKTSKVVGLAMSRTKILLDDSLISTSSKDNHYTS